MEQKEMLGAIETALKEAKGNWDQASKAEKEALEARIKELQEGKELSVKEIKALQDQFDELDIKLQEVQKQPKAPQTFKSLIGEGLQEKADEFKKLAGNKSKLDTSIDIKAVGDMNFANFGTGAYEAATTEVRAGLYQGPFSPLWLRNVLPNASTDKATIQYLRENDGEGAAALWTDANTPTDKPQVDFDFTLVTETVDWIAGITRIHRGQLDDVAWLRGFLSQQLVFGKRGLFVAENALIIAALDAASTAYAGTAGVPLVEKLYEAAFGQLKDNYFQPTTILVNNWDAVKEVMLNKASGSGEYDLPPGSVLVVDGQLTLGGVPVIGVPNIPSGSFYVLDRNQTQFVSRMSPEVRFFEEDRDNVIKNLITVRAEERAAALVFDSDAVIKGTVAS